MPLLSRKLFADERYTAALESLLIAAAAPAVGYLFRPDDPLLIGGDITYLVSFSAIVTLFFGMLFGLLTLAVFALMTLWLYPAFEYVPFLKLLVLTLIFGEFHHYWHRSIRHHKSQHEIFGRRLRQLGRAFYALKVSHDQLEFNYIVKPVSLRRSIRTVLDAFNEEEAPFHMLLVLFEKNFNINRGSLVLCTESGFVLKAASADAVAVQEEDPLLKRAVEENRPVYIAETPHVKSPYLAVIPSYHEVEGEQGVLLIEQMPFLAFNEDNLIAISFVFDYFFDTLHRRRILESSEKFPQFSEDFRFESIRMMDVYERYRVDSALILFKTASDLVQHQIRELALRNLRGLDVFDTFERGDVHISVILAPLTAPTSAAAAQKRLLEALEPDFRSQIRSSIFSFESLPLFEAYLLQEPSDDA